MHSNGTASHSGITTLSEILPHNEEAELSVLGSILIDPDAFYMVDAIIKPADFYSKERGTVYKAMADLYQAKTPVDVITLGTVLEKRGIEKVNGQNADIFIMGLVNVVPTAINATNYARIVEADSVRRDLIRAGREISNLGLKDAGSTSQLTGKAEAELFKVTAKSATHNVIPIREQLSQYYEIMQRRQSGDRGKTIDTGYVDIDRVLGGIDSQALVILAARPGMGKSMLEGNIVNNLIQKGKRIARFNLEMSGEQIVQRQMAMITGIKHDTLRKGQMTPAEETKFNEYLGKLSESSVWLDDTPGLLISQLRAKCTRLHMEHGLDLITVDYIGLMNTDRNHNNRVQEMGDISRSLKGLAKTLNVPILALSQLSRACEQRGDKRPLLSDLRDSGEIEQDADIVAFIYRDDYYNPDTTDRPNVAEINIPKNRHGKTGQADLYFNGSLMKFSNLMREEISL